MAFDCWSDGRSRRRFRISCRLALLSILVLLVRHRALAAGPVFIMLEENDLVVQTDRHYTQGIKFGFLHEDNYLPGAAGLWAEGVPTTGFCADANRFGYQVGQSIFTPADTEATELQRDDRPYAGWLYFGFIGQRRGTTAGWLTLENMEVQLGMIGPPSLAEQAQSWIHELRGFDVPRGWDHQLKTEPGIALRYQRDIRFSLEGKEPRYSDLIPHAGFSLGNVETSARAGVTLRLGVNLPENFGVQTISSLMTTDGGWSDTEACRPWGFYVFTGVEGWVVGYSAFLDGNLYQDSHSVQREPLVGEWKSGVAVVVNRVELGFTYVSRSPEFSQQVTEHSYGSVWLKTRF